MRRPSADAVAGNGGTLSCAPSADAVAGNEEQVSKQMIIHSLGLRKPPASPHGVEKRG
jgi:hypothetical protein